MSSPIPKFHPRGPESAAAAAPNSNGTATAVGASSPSGRPQTPTNARAQQQQQQTLTPRSTGRGSTTLSNKSPGRFSTKSGSPIVALDGSLLIDGMGRSPVQRGGCTSVFRSSTTTADAHIKALSQQYTKLTLGGSSSGALTPRGGTAAFRSTSPSDRDSHIKDLSSRAYAATGGRSLSPNGSSPSRRELPSAAFRSTSPNACAHILAVPKPVDASYSPGGGSARAATSWTKSTTSIADAHIKAMIKPHDGSTGLLSPLGGKGCTSVFRSTTSIADAHIKAVPKPVDVVVSYREIQ